jgi:hypothetical protein
VPLKAALTLTKPATLLNEGLGSYQGMALAMPLAF